MERERKARKGSGEYGDCINCCRPGKERLKETWFQSHLSRGGGFGEGKKTRDNYTTRFTRVY